MKKWEGATVAFDATANAWYVTLDPHRDNSSFNTLESARCVQFDYDGDGVLVGIEIL